MRLSDEPVRWIIGRRSDDAAPGGRVVAVVYRPMRQPKGEYVTRIRCAYLHSAYLPTIAGDEVRCLELAIWLVLDQFAHRGVRDSAISLNSPDDDSC